MKTRIFLLVVIALHTVTGAFATVIKPEYVPAPISTPYSSGTSTPERMVDNSGMTPKIFTGTSAADTLKAVHVFNALANASWLTIDPGLPGGHFFAEAAPPVLVFDVGRNRQIQKLYFWQLQRNLTPGSWAKDIEVRFAPDPGPGGGPPIFVGDAYFSHTLKSPAELGPFNRTQEVNVPSGTGLPGDPGPTARYIQLKITANRGGPQVGLGEFRVKVGDEPGIELPALIDLSSPLYPPGTVSVPVTNIGTTPFTITSMQFTGQSAAKFMVAPISLTVNPGDTAIISVGYPLPPPAPPSHPDDTAIATFTVLSGVHTSEISTVLIHNDPDIHVESSEIGPFPKGVGPQDFSLAVTNYGVLNNLIIDGISVSSTEADHFPQTAISLPGPIEPTMGSTIKGRFDPMGEEGPFNPIFTISSNDEVDSALEVKVTATLLEDLEISTPPVVTIPPIPGTAAIVSTLTADPGTTYSLGAVTIDSGGGGTPIFSPATIVSGDTIVIQITHDEETPGVHSLTIHVVLNKDGGLLSEFDITLTVRVGYPLELVARGFEGDQFRVSVSNVLPGETFHLRSSTDLVIWSPIGGPIKASGDVFLSLGPAPDPAMFFRLYEGPAPPTE